MRIISQRRGREVTCALGGEPAGRCGREAVAVVEDGRGHLVWGCAVHAAEVLTASATAQVVLFQDAGNPLPDAVSRRTPPPA